MGDAAKLVALEYTSDGAPEIIIDAQPSQFSDGYTIALTTAEALRVAHALIARVSDVRTSAQPVDATLRVAA